MSICSGFQVLVQGQPPPRSRQWCWPLILPPNSINGGLDFLFKPFDQFTVGVSGAQEQFDDRGGGERLSSAGGHLEQKAVFVILDRSLQRLDRIQLVIPKEAQFVGLDVAGMLRLR